MKTEIRNEEAAPYAVGMPGPIVFMPADDGIEHDDEILARAAVIAHERLTRMGKIASPADATDMITAWIGYKEHEEFGLIWLDTQHRVIKCEALFRGTLDACSVYPREILKRAIQLNAAAVILAHNHPSGVTDPSAADKTITKTIKDALSFIGVRVLDHVIVAPGSRYSFAEKGII